MKRQWELFNKKVPYADVTVYKKVECNVVGISFCDDWEEVKTEKSDKHGDYKIKFNDTGREYRISAAKEGYYKSGRWFVVSRDIENVDCYLFPQGTLHMHILNVNPVDENDQLELDIFNNGNHDILTTHYSFQGINVDSLFDFIVYANFSHQLAWKVIKNEEDELFADTIYCELGQDNYYNIFY